MIVASGNGDGAAFFILFLTHADLMILFLDV